MTFPKQEDIGASTFSGQLYFAAMTVVKPDTPRGRLRAYARIPQFIGDRPVTCVKDCQIQFDLLDCHRVDCHVGDIDWHLFIPGSVQEIDDALLYAHVEEMTDFMMPTMDWSWEYDRPIRYSLTIYGHDGSAAETFARQHGLPFVPVPFAGTQEEWDDYVRAKENTDAKTAQ